MSQWIWSGRVAALAGAGLFLLVFIPLLVWQQRRYGQLSPARMLGTAGVTVYLVAIVTYTWLPLPPRTVGWCSANAVEGIRWVPFQFVGDIRGAIATHGLTGSVTAVTVLQVVFNVVLFIPWGLFVRGFLHRSTATAVASGFFATLLVESTQATGLWGFYPCAYRFADVDDVMTNTLGALVGAALAPALVWWMPRARALEASRLDPRPVTAWRRWSGMAVDAFAVVMLSSLLTVVYRVVREALGRGTSGPGDVWWLPVAAIVPVVLVFWVPAWTGGRTGSGSAGHNAVWLTPTWRRRPDGSRVLRLVRSSVIAVPWLAASALPDGPVQDWLILFFFALVALAIALVPVTPGRASVSGMLTGARMTDLRQDRAAPPLTRP